MFNQMVIIRVFKYKDESVTKGSIVTIKDKWWIVTRNGLNFIDF